MKPLTRPDYLQWGLREAAQLRSAMSGCEPRFKVIDMAEKIGLSEAYFSLLVNGRVASIRKQYVEAIAAALSEHKGVTVTMDDIWPETKSGGGE